MVKPLSILQLRGFLIDKDLLISGRAPKGQSRLGNIKSLLNLIGWTLGELRDSFTTSHLIRLARAIAFGVS
jgi:hypothetical protein